MRWVANTESSVMSSEEGGGSNNDNCIGGKIKRHLINNELTRYFGTFLSPRSVLGVVFECRKLSNSLNQKTLGTYGSLPNILAVWIFLSSWQYVERMFLILFLTSSTVRPGMSMSNTRRSYASSRADLFL